MGDLFVPLLLSVASFAAGFYARNRGSRWLLLILGGATAAGLILIMGAEAMAVAADCTGPSVREMTCPSPSVPFRLSRVCRASGVSDLKNS